MEKNVLESFKALLEILAVNTKLICEAGKKMALFVEGERGIELCINYMSKGLF